MADTPPSGSSAHPIRLLMVDDHTILRQGLKQLIESAADMDIVGESDDGDDAVIKALSLKPDVILMDVNLPKVNGYEATRAILTTWPQGKILVLTNQDDPTVIQRFLDLGVFGFHLKDVHIDTLLASIRKIHRGDKIALTPELAEKMEQAAQRKKNPVVDLTDREKEVLKALAKGYSNRQLAELLVVSPKTVHNHLYNIYSKIGVSSRAEAIVWAMESGFNTSDPL